MIEPNTCTWIEDEDSNWGTACGNIAILNMFSPTANKMKYCWYCGKPLIEKPYVWLDEEEDPDGSPPDDNKAGRDYEKAKREGTL